MYNVACLKCYTVKGYLLTSSPDPDLRNLKTLLNIAVADINREVCKLPITSSIFNISSNFDSFAGIVPKAPKTTDTITVLTLNYLLTSAAKFMYLSFFCSSFSLT